MRLNTRTIDITLHSCCMIGGYRQGEVVRGKGTPKKGVSTDTKGRGPGSSLGV